jgi:hypothetical protein
MARGVPPAPPPRGRVRGSEVEEWLAWTRDADVRTRMRAVRALCPCHVRADHERVWARLLEMVADPEPRVRSQVFHTLIDGSPREREAEVVAAIESLRDDTDAGLRRRARQFLAQYRRTGRVNVG